MLLITGATGTIGRPLVDLLAADGVKVRAITRNPEAAELPAGVDLVPGDTTRPETLGSAFDGVTTLFLHPRAVREAAREVVALARRQGVQRVVAFSAMNVEEPLNHQPSRFIGDRNKEVEEAAVDSGIAWVSLRMGYFAGNTLRAWGAQIRAGDVIRGPYAAFAESPVHERDLAAVAARVLTSDAFTGRRLELTGPESLTHAEMVAVIGEVIGRPLRYEEVPPEIALHGFVRAGFDQPAAEALVARYARGVGEPAPVSNHVEEVLGRRAGTYAEWVAANAVAFWR